ncbi:hypothetical protein [Microbacterium kunmingense]|uniref:hypothetical protein n=1 Tax=Microbacterium kunmingense TaxID=2915939 RepID=UPI003D74AF3A
MFIIVFACAMQVGVALYSMLLSPAKPIRDVSAPAQALALRLARWSALPAVVAFVVVYGAENFLERPAYQPEYAVGALATLVGPFILASAFFTSVLSLSPERRDRRVGLLLLVLLALLLAGTASRQLGLLAIVWYLAYLLSVKHHRVTVGIASATIAYFSLAFAISARGTRVNGHGFFPYMQALVADPVQFLSQSFWSPVLNVLSAAPITDLSAGSDRVSAESFWVSVSPFSSSAEWAGISPSLRVHEFIPFSAIGELFALGPGVALGTAFAIGAFFALLLRTMARTAGDVGLLVGGASVLYVAVLLLQYNLRSSMRMLGLLASIVVIVLWILAGSKRTRSRSGLAPRDELNDDPLAGTETASVKRSS